MTLHSIVIQKLLSTNAHLGRRVATHHFKLFTYGNRNGMNIIDSDKTLICLRNACDFIASLVRQNGRFMFINTNPLFDEIFEQMTKKIGCYSSNINALWRTGGFLTNSCSPKKFRSRNKKLCFGPTQPPDCLVIMDTERKSSVILEAAKLQIPVVALVDSSMPWDCYKRITYPIPANDSVQFVYLLCNMITKTILLEQKKLAAAKAQLAIAKTETRDELRRIKDSTSKSDGGAEYAKIEVPVIPYEQLASLPEDVAEIKKLLDKLVVLKLNGTLGTSMGFDGPKSMIDIGNGMMVLDLAANRIKCLNSKYGCNVPLLLMNSSRTHDFTPEVLEKYQKPTINIHAFELNTHRRLSGEHINEDELVYAEQSALILSLMKAGTLDVLISQGKEYILVVSADNVGTIIDPKILNHLIQNNVECGMEVRPAASTAVNGSIQNFQGRTFQLGEIAQRPSEDLSQKFKLIDTKNLWVNLHAIKRVVDANATITGEDVSSSLLQETATGSAIRLFKHAIGINVPSSHFFPLNATSDLLLLQSDLYALSEGVLTRNPTRANPEDPSIHLGPEFETLSNFRSRFQSIPSVVELDRLKVIGDVWFGKGIKLKGNVSIVARPGTRIQIPDGVVLENKLINNPEDI